VQQRFAMLLNFLEQIFLAGLIIRGFAGVVGLHRHRRPRAARRQPARLRLLVPFLGFVLFWAYAAGVF
jgi:NADH-quinone oxidoreductase subunit L